MDDAGRMLSLDREMAVLMDGCLGCMSVALRLGGGPHVLAWCLAPWCLEMVCNCGRMDGPVLIG